MHTAIECACGNIIVYEIRLASITCPSCQRQWLQAPEMFSQEGTPAKRLPNLCARYANNPADNVMLGAIAGEIRKGFAAQGKPLPDTFTVVDGNGNTIDCPIGLQDFANTSTYKMQGNQV